MALQQCPACFRTSTWNGTTCTRCSAVAKGDSGENYPTSDERYAGVQPSSGYDWSTQKLPLKERILGFIRFWRNQ